MCPRLWGSGGAGGVDPPSTRAIKKPCSNTKFTTGSLKQGGGLLSHQSAVPSAQTGLTSLFGMVRGEPRRHSHPKIFVQGDPGLRSDFKPCY